MFVGKNFLPVDDQSQFESRCAPRGLHSSRDLGFDRAYATDVRQLPGVTDTLVTIGSGQQQLVNVLRFTSSSLT